MDIIVEYDLYEPNINKNWNMKIIYHHQINLKMILNFFVVVEKNINLILDTVFKIN